MIPRLGHVEGGGLGCGWWGRVEGIALVEAGLYVGGDYVR